MVFMSHSYGGLLAYECAKYLEQNYKFCIHEIVTLCAATPHNITSMINSGTLGKTEKEAEINFISYYQSLGRDVRLLKDIEWKAFFEGNF